ncbi:MAG: hypothetical protein ACOH2M_18605 [Cypionkella sp.]
MRGLLAAIRNVCRRMARALRNMKEEWVEIGGRLVRMLVPAGAPLEADEPETVEAPAVDDFGMKIRALASQLQGDGVPSVDLLASMSPDQVRWLSVCDDSMLRAIAKASDEEIDAHLRGRRYLRGVVRADRQGMDEYINAMMPDDMPEDELQTAMAWLPA